MRMVSKVPERINIIRLILTQDGRQKEDCVWLQKLVLYPLCAIRLSYLECFKLVEVLHLFEELPHIDAARRFAIGRGEGGNQSHHVAHQVNFPGRVESYVWWTQWYVFSCIRGIFVKLVICVVPGHWKIKILNLKKRNKFFCFFMFLFPIQGGKNIGSPYLTNKSWFFGKSDVPGQQNKSYISVMTSKNLIFSTAGALVVVTV